MMSEHYELAVVFNESLQEFNYANNFSFSGHSVCHCERIIILLFGITSLSLFGEIVAEIRAIIGNQSLHALLAFKFRLLSVTDFIEHLV